MTNDEHGLSKMKAESKSEWVWKSTGFCICKKLSDSDNIQIRIQTPSQHYTKTVPVYRE